MNPTHVPPSAETRLGPNSPMSEVLQRYPGAQRTLFRKYHIGGCSSCGFRAEETLGELCSRNGPLNPEDVLVQLQSSQEEDQRLLVTPGQLADWLRSETPPRILDVRSREEWDAARIAGSILLSNTVMQDILGKWPRDTAVVICDHAGRQAMDAAAYFAGHGFTNIRCLAGGVDAWSQDVDASVPRYRLS